MSDLDKGYRKAGTMLPALELLKEARKLAKSNLVAERRLASRRRAHAALPPRLAVSRDVGGVGPIR